MPVLTVTVKVVGSEVTVVFPAFPINCFLNTKSVLLANFRVFIIVFFSKTSGDSTL
ncbi:hypothetical protein QF042_003459 [Pedobacter sp. W3I1]|nr:hypothetical protein [Pedobacter sp. W3I1]